MSDQQKPIKQLILNFPHGASIKDCDYIAGKIQDVICATISSGGFLPTNKYGMNVDNMTFSEDTMMYEYMHKRDQNTKCLHGSKTYCEHCAKGHST